MTVIGLGVGTYALAWSIGVPGFPPPSAPMDHRAFIAFARDLGVKRVQIADNLPLHPLSPDAQDALRGFAAQRGIAVEVGTRGSAPDHMRAYIAIAQRFGSPIVRVVVDSAGDHPSPDEVVNRVRAVLPDLRAAGVTLAIENHDRFKAGVLADVIAAVDDPLVGICLDTVNSFGSLEGPDVVFAALARYVVNLHVKEFVIRRAPHNMGFEITGAPAGQGMLDVPRVLRLLDGLGRTYSAIIETWLPPVATPDATAAQEQAWTRESAAYLRGWIAE